ncbi:MULTISPECIES: hypothetical protein [Halobacterium]|uniref:hypothetical protein n=1 Tax=Halobacterium TaxID=2239 RepID=UPI0009EB6A25|nr:MULTISPECIES: hypothetical protein [Halobacterium]MCG1002913.1 hypothetical protein [Halobacterium noricense]
MQTLQQTDEHTVAVDDDHGIPVFTYEAHVSGEELRDIAREWADVAFDRGAERYVVNAQAIAAHDDEDKQWLAETWVPNLIENGVHAGAGVYADSAIAKMDNERIEEQLNAIDSGFEYRIFSSNREALSWLADQ